MATEKWIGGGVASFTSIMTTALNSIANGNAILAAADLDNTTALDMFAEFQISLASFGASGAGAYLGLYLYPLNQDASTYGDGRFASSAAGPPPAQFFAGIAMLVPSVTQAQQAPFRRPDGAPVIIPPYKFRPVIYNAAGAAFAASGNVLYWRTFNRQVA